ncbi:MAG: isoprenyl transferase [Planctomycetota bacterium]|nr:isoprenyl transferase [Planctomycetota bacterium]RLS37007.1 MAG: isoprenyl transferase [Planctomycetota bacterium]
MSSQTGIPKAHEHALQAGLDPARLPDHVAIIMDGNGRWAQRQGLRRVEGHARGVRSVRDTVEECCRLGLSQLTLYCLSSENWKRPPDELDFLMALLSQYLVQERELLMRENVRFQVIGRRDGLSPLILDEITASETATRDNTGLLLCLAINYGGRTELLDAFRRMAAQVLAGDLDPGSITEATVSESLYTAGMPDPDLLIRTAGEMRVSNFLLWQISYAELWVTERCWPDFDAPTLHSALKDYGRRQRRFGGLPGQAQP